MPRYARVHPWPSAYLRASAISAIGFLRDLRFLPITQISVKGSLTHPTLSLCVFALACVDRVSHGYLLQKRARTRRSEVMALRLLLHR